MDSNNNEKCIDKQSGLETAVLGGGCFWCIEAVYRRIEGVRSVESGYAGGHVPDPDYYRVCSGETGHAEAVKIDFDPSVITFPEILEIFWQAHDPTTINRQGADIGTQYRSIILYSCGKQRAEAEESMKTLNNSGKYGKPAVTEIVQLESWYPAEKHHQEYYENNRSAGYCRLVISPKLKKIGLE